MTRWEPSVLRACAMAACSMTALYLGRPTAGVRVLALAVVVLVLADPFLVHSIGFLLSCGASAGIAVLATPFTGRLPGPHWVREPLGVTLAAQIGVAPVLIPVFGSVPLAALPANLVAGPIAGPLTVLGLATGVAGGLVGSWWRALAEAEELGRVVPAVERLRARFETPLSVDTWRAVVLRTACKAGAVLGNDISGFADPDYLSTAAALGASVVATHIRLAPRVRDPEPRYDDLLGEVQAFLLARAGAAEAAGLAPEQIALDPGLDLGKTPAQSAVLLRESDAFASLGYTLLLSASNKRFLGELLDLAIDDRRDASLAAVAFGV